MSGGSGGDNDPDADLAADIRAGDAAEDQWYAERMRWLMGEAAEGMDISRYAAGLRELRRGDEQFLLLLDLPHDDELVAREELIRLHALCFVIARVPARARFDKARAVDQRIMARLIEVEARLRQRGKAVKQATIDFEVAGELGFSARRVQQARSRSRQAEIARRAEDDRRAEQRQRLEELRARRSAQSQ
jgi:hypothetical protein